MPKKNPEHNSRLETRLSKNMLHALKWTAEHDRLPLSDWVRKVLNENCYSVSISPWQDPPEERLEQSGKRRHLQEILDWRPLKSDAGQWQGERQDKTKKLRIYIDMDGNQHIGNLPEDPHEKMNQDMMMDRQQARRELRTWKNKWARELKTNCLNGEQQRLLDRLLATFDRDA